MLWPLVQYRNVDEIKFFPLTEATGIFGRYIVKYDKFSNVRYLTIHLPKFTGGGHFYTDLEGCWGGFGIPVTVKYGKIYRHKYRHTAQIPPYGIRYLAVYRTAHRNIGITDLSVYRRDQVYYAKF